MSANLAALVEDPVSPLNEAEFDSDAWASYPALPVEVYTGAFGCFRWLLESGSLDDSGCPAPLVGCFDFRIAAMNQREHGWE